MCACVQEAGEQLQRMAGPNASDDMQGMENLLLSAAAQDDVNAPQVLRHARIH